MGNPGYVDFSWLPPLSWGAAGPHPTNRYAYEFRHESASTGNLNPWTNVISNHNSRTVRVPWGAAHQHPPNRVQFRVRAVDADGNASGWLESDVLTEDAVNPTGGRFAGRFRGRFA